MFREGFNLEHLTSKEGLTKRARHVHFICPSLSAILWHLEILLLGSVALPICRIHHTRKTFLPQPCSTTSCRLGIWHLNTVKLHLESLKLSPSINSFVQRALKTSLKRRQTDRLVLCAV